MIAETCLHERNYPAGTSMAPHHHPTATLNIVVRGGFVERMGRRERDYARGHIAYLPAGREHAQTFGAHGARQMIFELPSAWIDYLADSGAALVDAPYANGPVYERIGDHLSRELRNPDAYSTIACEGLMLEVVAAFGRDVHGQCVSPPPWLRAARDYVHENACEPLTLADVAEAVGRHEIHLAREFRRYFGTPVLAYQRRLRIQRAVRLLDETRLTLVEIALDCGFASHAHFCREFRNQMGATPSQRRSRRT